MRSSLAAAASPKYALEDVHRLHLHVRRPAAQLAFDTCTRPSASSTMGPKSKGEPLPQTADVAKLVLAKPKKVDVRVEVLGQEEAVLEVATKARTAA